MSSSVPEEPRLIEGVGDEIIIGGLTLLGVLIPTVLSIRSLFRQRNQPGIHPDSAATIDSTRQHLDPQTHGGSSQHQPQPQTRHTNTGQLTCPICLGDAAYAVETNCGHLYCGQCILMYWQHRSWFGTIPCPSCRARVTLLLLNFTEVEATEGTGTANQVRQGVANFNRRFSGEPRTIMDTIRDTPALLRHAWTDYRFSFRAVSLMYQIRVLLLLLLALIYLLSPFDILSESALGIFGYVDDFLVVFIILVYVSILYRQFVAAQT